MRSKTVSLVGKAAAPPWPSSYFLVSLKRKGIGFQLYCCSNINNNNSNTYLTLKDEELMRQCELNTFKASGPGGQHRNKRESAVRLKHLPTGIIARAVEDRSQHMNRASALARLRTLIALKEIRSPLNRIHRLPSFFKFFPETQRSGDLILVPKLGLTIPSLYWVCRLCLI
ncbi:hypothetical protein V6Z11_D08G271500 [Gossypium hirsutum]